jgi:hypothetical protein
MKVPVLLDPVKTLVKMSPLWMLSAPITQIE